MMNNDMISRSALLSGYDVRKVTEYDESGCGVDYKAVPVEAIEKAPAVDAEPVRHGRWIDMQEDDTTEGMWRCSICGSDRYFDILSPLECGCHYCPNCGAKMMNAEDAHENT